MPSQKPKPELVGIGTGASLLAYQHHLKSIDNFRLSSFRLTRNKILQSELKSYESLRIFDSNRRHVHRIPNRSRGKEFIKVYRLWMSQLAFCVVEMVDETCFTAHRQTLVFSRTMSDEMYQSKESDETMSTNSSNDGDDQHAICTPEKGSWEGGDKVLMVLPAFDRKKPLCIYFDYGENNDKRFIEYELVDVKTILFKTPACLSSIRGEDSRVSIVAVQNERRIGTCDFLYMSQYNMVPRNTILPSHELDASFNAISSVFNSNELSSTNLDDWLLDEQLSWS